MALAFNPNTPGAANTVASTQGPIQTNFASIATAFNNLGGTFSQYALQNYTTPVTPTAPVGILHTNVGVNALANNPVPFWLTALADYPMLPDLKTSVISGVTAFGFKFGNVIINWGLTTQATNIISFTYAIPFTAANSYILLGMPSNGGTFNEGQWTSQNNSNTTGQLRRGTGATGSVTAMFFAIGT